MHRHPVSAQVDQELVRHVLVLEGEDVGTVNQGSDRRLVPGRTDR